MSETSGGRILILHAESKDLPCGIKDVEAVRECFGGHYGFEVEAVSGSPGEMQPRINRFMDGCAGNDVAVLYLTGHGQLDGGRLYFVGQDGRNEAKKWVNRLDLTSVLEGFRRVDARTRLVLMDCCNATRAQQLMEFSAADEFVVFAASRFLEGAKEVKELGKSYFTWQICEVLQWPDPSIVGTDGRIRLRGFTDRVIQEWRVNKERWKGVVVPEPRVLVNQNDFPMMKVRRNAALSILRILAEVRNGSPLPTGEQVRRSCPDMSEEKFGAMIRFLMEERYIDRVAGGYWVRDLGRQYFASLNRGDG